MPDPDAILGRVVMERIAELRKWRHWYRAQPNPAFWTDLAADNITELRSLLRLLREARRRPAAERTALAAERLALTADRDDLPTSEDAEDFDDRGNHFAFPEGVIEGLPEFNGSFR